MNPILVILGFLWGLIPRRPSEVQLVPVRGSRNATFGGYRRMPRLFWVPGAGWLTFHSESMQRETGIKRSRVNHPLLGFYTRGWRRLRLNRCET